MQLDVHGCPLTVLVNHWPSERDGKLAEAERCQVAKMVQRVSQHKGHVVIVGDFNAGLGETSVAKHLSTTHDKCAARNNGSIFFDAMHDAAYNKPSAVYQPITSTAATNGDPCEFGKVGTCGHSIANGRREVCLEAFDHIILSAGLLRPESEIRYVLGSCQVVCPDWMSHTATGCQNDFGFLITTTMIHHQII